MTESKPADTTIAGEVLLSRIQTLTGRETEVLEYILKGLSNDQIALALFRSPKTVDKHCQRIYRKLDVHRRVNLVRLCLESGYSGGNPEQRINELKPRVSVSGSGDDPYAIVNRLMQKGKAWDRLTELERVLTPASGSHDFGEFVCALTKVFGVRYAGISQSNPGDSCATVIAHSVDGELIPESDEYEIDGTPCKNTLRDGRFFIPEGACSAFPSDDYLAETFIESYAGVRLDDRSLGALGLLWICDDKPMPKDEMQLEVLGLIAPAVASELAVQGVFDRADVT